MQTMTPAIVAHFNKDLAPELREILNTHAIKPEDLKSYVVDIEYIEDDKKIQFVILINGYDYYFYANCGEAIDVDIERSFSNHEYDKGDYWTAPAGGGTFEDHKENVTDEIAKVWLFKNLNTWTLES